MKGNVSNWPGNYFSVSWKIGFQICLSLLVVKTIGLPLDKSKAQVRVQVDLATQVYEQDQSGLDLSNCIIIKVVYFHSESLRKKCY